MAAGSSDNPSTARDRPTLALRPVADADLPHFFRFQQDPAANEMAAFTAENPSDRDAFDAHWAKIRGQDTVEARTILVDGRVAGHIAKHEGFGVPEVTYWLGRDFWGRGIATRALAAFLDEVTIRPLYARVAADNISSRRVLEKCGFAVTNRMRGFANARGREIEELELTLE